MSHSVARQSVISIGSSASRTSRKCCSSLGIGVSVILTPRLTTARSFGIRLGLFLKGRDRQSYVVSTKVGRLLSPGETLEQADGFIAPLPMTVRYDYSGDGIEAAFEQSCARLGTSYIDVLYVHDIGRLTHGACQEVHMADLLGTGIDRLQRLKQAGGIGAFGLGVNENEASLEVMAAAELDVILLAGHLTLIDRSAEEALVARCRKSNTSLVLGGIFNSGILATGPVPDAVFDYKPATPHMLGDYSKAAPSLLRYPSPPRHFTTR